MTWYPLPGLCRFWLRLWHGIVGHPRDDREENKIINTVWCGSCGASLGEDDRP